jgi:hypothetical protein
LTSIQTAGAGKKASAALGKSTKVAATGMAANGRFSEPKPDLLMKRWRPGISFPAASLNHRNE